MKRLFTLLLIAGSTTLWAQSNDCSTTQINISGEIKTPLTIDAAAMAGYTVVAVPDVTITNHKGEFKKKFSGMKGILVKDILEKVVINSESPKTLSEYYFVFTACDGYKVVYSWNEIFNTATGNNIFLLTEKDGDSGSAIKEGLVTITPTDEKTGRRYVKGMASITVQRAK